MKKLVQTIAFLLGLTSAAITIANESLQMVAVCKPLSQNREFLETYNEQPFAGGPSVIRTPNGSMIEGAGKIYVDPQGKGFTIIIEFDEIKKGCVMLMGDDFAPLLMEPNV